MVYFSWSLEENLPDLLAVATWPDDIYFTDDWYFSDVEALPHIK